MSCNAYIFFKISKDILTLSAIFAKRITLVFLDQISLPFEVASVVDDDSCAVDVTVSVDGSALELVPPKKAFFLINSFEGLVMLRKYYDR